MPLPTTPTAATAESMSPDRQRSIYFGEPGHGKTTLAAGWFPQTNLILDCEGGTRFLGGQHFVQRIKTYDEFTVAVNELVAGGHHYKTVTIDTIDAVVRMADAAAGQRGGKVAAGLVEFGKGMADRDGVVMRDLSKLLSTDLGVILIAHPVVASKVGESGKEEDRLYPAIDKQDRIRGPVIGLFDSMYLCRKRNTAAGEVYEIVTGGLNGVETKRRVPLPDVLPANAQALYEATVAGVQQILAPTTQTQAVAS